MRFAAMALPFVLAGCSSEGKKGPDADETRVRWTRMNMQTTADAIYRFLDGEGRPPKSLEELSGEYAPQGDMVDGWNRPLLYRVDGEKWNLHSLGADGREGGTGADADFPYFTN